MARGFGGQRMMVFPEEGLIVDVHGWDIIGDPPADKELSARLLPALKSRTCGRRGPLTPLEIMLWEIKLR